MRLIGLVVVLTASLVLAPLAAGAQPDRRVPLIAVLERGAVSPPPGPLLAFRQGLRELGWLEGQTVSLEIRYASWKTGPPLDALAAELVALQPDVLWTHSNQALRAVLKATTTVPVVVGGVSDLVGLGLVRSLARPGGNVTGMTFLAPDLDRKRIEVLKEMVPRARRLGALIPRGASTTPEGLSQAIGPVREAAGALGLQIQIASPLGPTELDSAIDMLKRGGADALFIQDGPVTSQAEAVAQIAAAARRHRLPTVSQMPGFAEAGGLLQYGFDVLDMMRRSATHVDRILKGAKPGDLPVEQPTKIELIVNARTAKTLGLTIPQSVLLRADQVIE